MRAALWRAARTLRVSGDPCARQSTVTCRATQLKRRQLNHRDMSGPRGAFIVLEGTDRSGKSTQCARLVAALNAAGVTAESWRFPDRTTGIGHMLDAYLRGTPDGDTDDGAVHLLFSANRWEKRHVARVASIQVSRHDVFALCVATTQGGLIAEAPSRHYTCS